MKIPEINEIEIPVQGKEPQKVGIRHNNKSVYIYFIGEEGAAADNSDWKYSDIYRLAEAVQNVHTLCFPNAPIDALNWHIRSGYAVSDVTFSTDEKGEIEKIDVSNMAVYHKPSFAPLSDYQQDKFREFNPVLTLKMEPYKNPAEVFVQKRPDGKSHFFEHYSNSNPADQAVIFVNAKQLMALIQACSPEQYMSAEQAKMRWDLETTTSEHGPQSLSKIGCFKLNGKLHFGINSGWADHVMALCHSGIECFPVAVNKGEAQLLNQLCGARQEKWQDPKKPNNNPKR